MGDLHILEVERDTLRLAIDGETLPDGLVDGRVGDVEADQGNQTQRLAGQLERKLRAPRHGQSQRGAEGPRGGNCYHALLSISFIRTSLRANRKLTEN